MIDPLAAVLIGGREERSLVLVAYDTKWPRRFEAERRKIRSALGSLARRIEHVGSTAVEGLAAKDIVDILVSVDDPDDDSAHVAPLATAGYELRVREPQHRMLRTPERDVHVHLWQADSQDEWRHLAFRDRLRSCEADRRTYELVKRDLVGLGTDMNRYAQAKTEVIEAILAGGAGTEERRSELR